MLKIMIKRSVPAEREKEVLALITQLRIQATQQAGYVSGETLRSPEEPGQILVISIWEDDKDWQRWVESDARKELQARIDAIAGAETVYERYMSSGMPHAD